MTIKTQVKRISLYKVAKPNGMEIGTLSHLQNWIQRAAFVF